MSTWLNLKVLLMTKCLTMSIISEMPSMASNKLPEPGIMSWPPSLSLNNLPTLKLIPLYLSTIMVASPLIFWSTSMISFSLATMVPSWLLSLLPCPPGSLSKIWVPYITFSVLRSFLILLVSSYLNINTLTIYLFAPTCKEQNQPLHHSPPPPPLRFMMGLPPWIPVN